MWRRALELLFALILIGMLAVTTIASFSMSVFDAGYLFSHPWFVATFVDAYFGFLTFYVWVVYKERTLLLRTIWFVLIMCLGNIAMSAYMLLQLAKLRPGSSFEDLLLRHNAKVS